MQAAASGHNARCHHEGLVGAVMVVGIIVNSNSSSAATANVIVEEVQASDEVANVNNDASIMGRFQLINE